MATIRTSAARYMAQFRCLGGSCEDSCCGGWTIPLNQPTHRRLKVLAEDDPVLGQLLAEAVELTPQGPEHARLRDDASGRCGLLDHAGLCTIHARLGADVLPDVCATYPRYYNEVDGQLELFGTLSCPEVARLCLLHEGSLELQTLSEDAAPRKLRNRFRTETPYYQPFVKVRGAFIELLSRPGFALDERLFVVLWIANKLADVVRADAKTLPLRDLSAALTSLLEPRVADELVASYRTLELDNSWVQSVMDAVLNEAEAPRAAAQELHATAQELPAVVTAAALERIDAYLTRYCVNHVYTTPYMLYADLFAFARDLVWRVAALRVSLRRRIDATPDLGTPEALECHVIDVVYRFARRVEHSDLLSQLDQLLQGQGLNSFAHSVCFLRA